MQYITDQQIDQLASETGKALQQEKKIRMMIPAKSSKDKFWEGGINGHTFRFPTDTEVDLPESLCTLIQQNRRVLKLGEAQVAEFAKGNGKKVG